MRQIHRRLVAAGAGFAERPSIAAADALGWVLHMAGRNSEALSYMDQAMRLGTRSATMHYHRGAILAQLGQRAAAKAEFEAALRINPNFSVRYAPIARAALAELRTVP
jgi:Flp pilus assembly protein TadD